MSTPASPFNPSRQVERIREILVGRQMAQVEHRLNSLEHHRSSAPPNGRHLAPATPSAASLRQIEEGLSEESQRRNEEIARLSRRIQQGVEDLRQQLTTRPPATEIDERFGSLRTELRHDHAQLHRELQQESRERIATVRDLAARISRLAADQAGRRGDDGGAAVTRLRNAIEDWQQRFTENLQGRERWLISQLREELDRLRRETWHWLGELDRRKADKS